MKQVGVDTGDGFLSARYIYPDGILAVESAQQVKHKLPAGLILIHSDLLPDYPLLLLDRFGGEIRILHEIKQYFKRFGYIGRAFEEVGGAFKRGIGVCAGTRLGKALESVQILALKELMLKEMRRALGNGFILAVLIHNARIYRAVFDAVERKGGFIILFGQHKDLEPRRMLAAKDALAEPLVFNLTDLHFPSPFRRTQA